MELEEYMLYMNGIVLEPAYMYTEIGTGKTRIDLLASGRILKILMFLAF